MNHDERIAELTTAFTESMARFRARLDAAAPEALAAKPADGGWSPAEVAWHVGAINTAFAGLIDGSLPNARPAVEGFVETPWQDIAARVPAKLDAPERFHPPAGVSPDEALQRLRESESRLVTALRGLSAERAVGYTVKSSVGTPVNLYQVGNWAAAHVARHNAQVKRALGA
jgi:hypothetical protein